ncbi:hypothetical protein GRI39_05080 [Altererythrobacter indicus]|uniref:CHAD domain-containing protein n=1 Tax=Altericroceibacterium indicum TaxID=374177 RepID=A0A845AA53_9SPHN|nr:hypothetical protein [Altericroceibacterium indicum]MXP25416.1 hypothetical protein [Altericroceibacterium indicum]
MNDATSRQTFSPETLDALFEAVDTDDIVDPVVSLPNPVPMACTSQTMRACLDLCLQFWREGAVRSDMIGLTNTLLQKGDLSGKERVRYKHIRARYKHLRFALVLYGQRHKAPFLFRCTVAVMGHLQDAFRNHQSRTTAAYALLLRVLLSWPVWLAVQREMETVKMDSEQGFLTFRQAEFQRLAEWLESGTLTAHRFHTIRKIISRQVSFYDTMRTLAPNEQLYRMSRFLSAINGLMGSMHDELVEQAGRGQRDYRRDDVLMPMNIRSRLDELIAQFG